MPATWRAMVGHLVGMGIISGVFLALVLTGHAVDSEPAALLALIAALVGGMIGVPMSTLAASVTGLLSGTATAPTAASTTVAAPAAEAPPHAG